MTEKQSSTTEEDLTLLNTFLKYHFWNGFQLLMNESHHYDFKVLFADFKMWTPQEPNAHSYPVLEEKKNLNKM